MNEYEINNIVNKHRNYFLTGTTLNTDFRLKHLKLLKSLIIRYEDKIAKALNKDLGKSPAESYMCETGLVISEINYMIKHLKQFSRTERVRTPMAHFYSSSFKKPSPYGTVLIMSPWNYPFLLTMSPLVDAIAAGNTAVIKPSAYSPDTEKIIQYIINKCFSDKYVSVITGGRKENAFLLNQHFDYIFFTGSEKVGKLVMGHAATHLTPVTLELGGKSPCIVDKTADIKLAAKRIVFGKFLNCGQTCVAPDYIYCDSSVKYNLVNEIIRQIKLQYGKRPIENVNYGKIINEKHFNRLLTLADKSKTVYGGRYDKTALKIEPTIMDNVTFKDKVMQEEIFGPILPVLTFNSIKDAVAKINSLPHPLALYIFTENKFVADKVISRCSFGGGCINDTVIHLATTEMGFGGFGESGMGSYHGKAGFETFSHYKSIVDKSTKFDLPVRYQPYNRVKEMFIRKVVR